MIKVKVTKDSDMIKSVSILGHAMYADFGKDIVCSAASSIVTTTINGILSFDKEGLSYEVSKDGLVIKNIKTDNITQTLLNNMISLLKELEKDYPTNVEVK
ncbi:MAG: ribosomal-processing cysteine protease Prp [Bacilli bacterium]|nr:ribosomal-processing cysteine protease Prp [Mycoplasmatota bacterium]MDD6263868.1 ribosomal-processing cysteine protease Prp [bacterium]MDD6941684.1 ribosomal-processing cysteine protease Prp [bacterium]MDY2697075.1 ribosomal-processing cysteine protease Prp [Bacilli bacterium]MEE0014737.1 ribosomal-processing cysteine protease Prp [Bacilli bacterium]